MPFSSQPILEVVFVREAGSHSPVFQRSKEAEGLAFPQMPRQLCWMPVCLGLKPEGPGCSAPVAAPSEPYAAKVGS